IRGGSSESTVVIADREIVTPPIVPSAWAVLAMHPEGLPAIGRKAERGGVLVFNSTLVHAPPAWDGVSHIPVPATEMAKAMGQPMGASMLALGALAAATGRVAVASLPAAPGQVPPTNRMGYRYPLLLDGCTGCELCYTICPDYCFEVYRGAA